MHNPTNINIKKTIKSPVRIKETVRKDRVALSKTQTGWNSIKCKKG